MKSKISDIKYDNLYVGFSVKKTYMKYEHPETFYDDPNEVFTKISVFPQPHIIYSKFDENGIEKFYDLKTQKEITENNFKSSDSISFHQSMVCTSGPNSCDYGYFVPINDYINEKLGLNLKSITLKNADKFIRFINLKLRKKASFDLSSNEEIARNQLKDNICYHINTKTQKKEI